MTRPTRTTRSPHKAKQTAPKRRGAGDAARPAKASDARRPPRAARQGAATTREPLAAPAPVAPLPPPAAAEEAMATRVHALADATAEAVGESVADKRARRGLGALGMGSLNRSVPTLTLWVERPRPQWTAPPDVKAAAATDRGASRLADKGSLLQLRDDLRSLLTMLDTPTPPLEM